MGVMEEYPIGQSAKTRALEDTKKSRHSLKFWSVEAVATGGFVYLATVLAPEGASRLVSAAYPTVGGIVGAIVGFAIIYLKKLITAPTKQRNEARTGLRKLEEERIPKITVQPHVGRREVDLLKHDHLMWAELEICNTSPGSTLEDVGIQVAELEYVMPEQDAPAGHYIIVESFPRWNRTGIYWSERCASPQQLRQPLNPCEVKTALIAFQDNPNGGTAIFNTPIQPNPWIVGGAKIKIQITSCDSAMWEGDFYIECHPNYLGGDRAKFEFVKWETWATNRNITLLTLGKGDSET